MPPFPNLIEIQKVFNHLGVLFLNAPNEHNTYEHFILPFKIEGLIWPLDIKGHEELEHYYAKIDWHKETMQEEWRIVLGGPNALKAPPFGSVYQDKEHVIYGSSYHKLVTFLSENRVAFTLDEQIPEDHIGVLFLALSYLAGENPALAAVLLEEHILTWSFEYLTQIDAEHKKQHFYCFLAKLAFESLEWLKAHWLLTPQKVPIYPYFPA